MDNPDLLNCIILARNTLPLFSSLPPSLSSPIFLSSSPSSIFPLSLSSSLYSSLLLHPSIFLFPLFLFLFTSLFLPSSLSSPPSHPSPLIVFPSSIWPLLFSPCYKQSLNHMLHDTSYSCIFISL